MVQGAWSHWRQRAARRWGHRSSALALISSPAPPALGVQGLTHLSTLPRSMASAFQEVVKSVVRELDHGGELIPVSSLRSSTSYRPYCLLVKLSRSKFWRHRYTCVHLSIRDILEPSTPEPGTPPGTELEPGLGGQWGGPLGPLLLEVRPFSGVSLPGWDLSSGLAADVECDGPFLFEDTVDGQLGASVELGASGQAAVEGKAAVSGSSSTSMYVHTLRVSPNTWMAMVQER